MWDILLLVGLILLNGVFALSEIALVASRKARLTAMVEDEVPGAQTALALSEDPTRALSTIQVGITSIGVLSGIVGEAALASPVAEGLKSLGLAARTADVTGVVLVVVSVTYFSIVLGELVPKRLGQLAPETLACRVAGPLNALSVAAAPFVRLLSGSTSLLLKRLGADRTRPVSVTEDEVHALISEGEESGVFERSEREMVRNVLRLDDRQVSSLMVPRSEIEWVDLQDSREINIEKIRASQRSRMPVCAGGLEDVRGICTTRTLLQQLLSDGEVDFSDHLQSAVYVPESLTGMELLENFRQNDTPLALVVDEYGSVNGLVTPRDVLEALVGEFKPESPADAWVRRRDDGTLVLDGLIPVPELKDVLQIRRLPSGDAARYSTLSGMLMWQLGRLPREGDRTLWQGWRFEIIDMDGRRVDKVLVSRIAETGASVSEGPH